MEYTIDANSPIQEKIKALAIIKRIANSFDGAYVSQFYTYDSNIKCSVTLPHYDVATDMSIVFKKVHEAGYAINPNTITIYPRYDEPGWGDAYISKRTAKKARHNASTSANTKKNTKDDTKNKKSIYDRYIINRYKNGYTNKLTDKELTSWKEPEASIHRDEDKLSDWALAYQEANESHCPTFGEFMLAEGVSSEKNLIVLRGLPGAGKSTFANLLSGGDSSIVCCADDHFERDGQYNFNPKELGAAHSECQSKCLSLMESGAPLIIISNTNVSESHMQVYFDMAERYGYKSTSVIVENRHGNKSIHNVPDAAVNKMRNDFKIRL